MSGTKTSETTKIEEGLVRANAHRCGVPSHMIDGWIRYIVHRISPGSFGTAVLCNDLRGAMGAADEMNRRYLYNTVNFLYNYAPGDCWGSREKYLAWMEGKDA